MSQAEQIRKLKLRSGDVICLPAHTEPEWAEQFVAAVTERYPQEHFLVVIGDVQALDEAAMAAAGWYRK